MPKILVVDDNEANRDLAVRYLELKGFQTVMARDGAEAIALTRSEQPDLIVLDMDMPVLSGWDAARQLKDEPATSGVPILALTAHAMIEDRRRAMRAGCDDYLSKPMDLRDLLAKVQELLARPAA